jgi:hypothetical protein
MGDARRRLLSADLSKYAIFGDAVVSPCDGDVVDTVDGLPDLIPPSTDRKNTKGNHIVLHCRALDVDVLLAHLQSGSVQAVPVKRCGAVNKSGALGTRATQASLTSTFKPLAMAKECR